MAELVRKLEKAITQCLVVMMSVVLILATLELGWIIIKDVITPPLLLLEIDELLDIFGIFMLVLIGPCIFGGLQRGLESQLPPLFCPDHGPPLMSLASDLPLSLKLPTPRWFTPHPPRSRCGSPAKT